MDFLECKSIGAFAFFFWSPFQVIYYSIVKKMTYRFATMFPLISSFCPFFLAPSKRSLTCSVSLLQHTLPLKISTSRLCEPALLVHHALLQPENKHNLISLAQVQIQRLCLISDWLLPGWPTHHWQAEVSGHAVVLHAVSRSRMDQSSSFSHGHVIGRQQGHLLSRNCGMLADSALQIRAYRTGGGW